MSKSSEKVKCKVCDSGEMIRKKKYRMGGIVVLIGWIFLVPSLIGMIIGVGLMLFAGSEAAVDSTEKVKAEARAESREDLEAAGIPEDLIKRALSGENIPYTDQAKYKLSKEQTKALMSAWSNITGSNIGASAAPAVAGGMGFMLLISSLCGGLLGWLLTMKKRVLQCNSCGAVIAAS